MNPGEIYTAPDGRKYRAVDKLNMCHGCVFSGHDDDCHKAPLCAGIIFKHESSITYTLIESLRTGKSWPGGMPDSNSFHEGAKAMAIHLGYEVEGTIHTP